jgi:hypothetical protein
MAAGSLVKVSTASHIQTVDASSKADASRAFYSLRSAMKNYAKRSSSITPVAILCVPILIAMTLIVLTVFGVIHVGPN